MIAIDPLTPRGHRLALVCAAALLLAACALPRCAHADPAAHPIVQRRVAQAWPEIEVAADLAGIPPAIFAALLACESGLDRTAISADGEDHGAGQLRLRWWRSWLAGEGFHADDVYGPDALEIVGRAMRFVAWRYDAVGWRGLLCIWAVGPKGRDGTHPACQRRIRRLELLGVVFSTSTLFALEANQ